MEEARPGTVVHAIIPPTWKTEIGESQFKASPCKKLIRSYLKSNPKPGTGGSCL
jgi:hypothetical protein